jgi:CheY-like chemotaxis protein
MLREAALEEALVILVVEDDRSIQSIVQEALSDCGFEPAIASSGEEALTLLSGSKYRVLVIDIKSSVKNPLSGWSRLKRCHESDEYLAHKSLSPDQVTEGVADGGEDGVGSVAPKVPEACARFEFKSTGHLQGQG